MRCTPPSTIVLGTAANSFQLPACLRTHGTFEAVFELPQPNPQERAAVIASWLPCGSISTTAERTSSHCVCNAPLTRECHADLLARFTTAQSFRSVQRLLSASAVHAASRGTELACQDFISTMNAVDPSWVSNTVANASTSLLMNVSSCTCTTLCAPTADLIAVGGYASVRQRLARLLEAKRGEGIGHCTLGLRPPSGALLYGPSGNGKSLLVSSVAKAKGWPTLYAKGSQLFGAYVGETEAAIRELFRKARETTPCILILDELDALGASRGGCVDSLSDDPSGGGPDGRSLGATVSERALSTLLNEMDGIGEAGPVLASPNNAGPVFFIGLTNRPDLVDNALLRPGRLEQLIHVGFPDTQERADVMNVHLRGLRLGGDVHVEELAAVTGRFSCAALGALCREATLQGLIRCLQRHTTGRETTSAQAKDGKVASEAIGQSASNCCPAIKSVNGQPARDYSYRADMPFQTALDFELTAADFELAADLVRGMQVLGAKEHVILLQRDTVFQQVCTATGEVTGRGSRVRAGSCCDPPSPPSVSSTAPKSRCE